jgi:hypothetical protein
MLLDQVTDTQLQAARLLGGTTMVAFLAAPLFRRQARNVRIVVTALYIAGVLGFLIYELA